MENIQTSRNLFRNPLFFGLSIPEMGALIVIFSLLCSFMPERPLVTGAIVVFLYIAILTVKNFLGYHNARRLPGVLVNKEGKGSVAKTRTFIFKVESPEFSDQVFENFSQYRRDVLELLKSIDVPISVQFLRKKLNAGDCYSPNNSEYKILSNKRFEHLNKSYQTFENQVFVIVEERFRTKFLDSTKTQDKWSFKELENNPSLDVFPVLGFRKSNELHRRDEVIHNFEFRALPEEFRLKDLSDLLRGNPHEMLLTIHIRRESNSRFIRKLNFRYQQLKKLTQGQASTKVERNLSLEKSMEVISSLVRGSESIYSCAALLSIKRSRSEDPFNQSFGFFKNSFKKALFLESRSLKGFHSGVVQEKNFERVLMPSSDLSAFLPFALNLYGKISSQKNKHTFFSSFHESLYISGFQDKDVPNGNALIFGQSGKGKSFLCGGLFSSLIEQNQDTDVVLIDTGMGFNGFTKSYGGKTFSMSQDQESSSGLNFIEFLKLEKNKEQQEEHLFNFLNLLYSQKKKKQGASEGSGLTIKQDSLLRKLCSEFDLNLARSLEELKFLIEENDKLGMLEELTLSLSAFCRSGVYGRHFDSEEINQQDFSSRVLYFTAPAVASVVENELILPYFFVINLLISIRSKLLSKDHRRVIVLWDEVASLMEVAPNVVSSMWNCMRKTGNSVYCCAQHPEQLSRIRGGEDILQNSPTRFFLGASNQVTAVDSIVSLSEAERIYLRDRRPVDPFLLVRENEKYWIRLETPAFHYGLLTTKKEEVLELQQQRLQELKQEKLEG